MRIAARKTAIDVTTAPDTAHPIRMRTSIAVFQLDPAEAIELANQLADAVETIEKGITNE